MQNRVEKYFCIGNLTALYDGPDFKETEYLGKFRVPETEPDFIYRFAECKEINLPDLPCVVQKDYIDVFRNEDEQVRIIYGQDKDDIVMMDRTSDGKHHEVKIPEKWTKSLSSRLVLNLFDFPHQVLNHGGIFLHASYVVWKGKAILFTAQKQVGKSTQARLWETYAQAQIVNGDRALLRKKGDCWMVYGSPYCGSSKVCQNVTAPLGAVVILSQGPQDQAAKADVMESVIAFMDGSTFHVEDKGQVEHAADIIHEIIKDANIYKLKCTPTENAVRVLEEILW